MICFSRGGDRRFQQLCHFPLIVSNRKQKHSASARALWYNRALGGFQPDPGIPAAECPPSPNALSLPLCFPEARSCKVQGLLARGKESLQSFPSRSTPAACGRLRAGLVRTSACWSCSDHQLLGTSPYPLLHNSVEAKQASHFQKHGAPLLCPLALNSSLEFILLFPENLRFKLNKGIAVVFSWNMSARENTANYNTIITHHCDFVADNSAASSQMQLRALC